MFTGRTEVLIFQGKSLVAGLNASEDARPAEGWRWPFQHMEFIMLS